MSGGAFAVSRDIPNPVFIENSKSSVRLGGGIKGYIPQAIQNVDNYDAFAVTRFTLRNAWNTNYSRQASNQNKRIITPFRAVNNAGDVLSRLNYSCGGNCQTPQSRPGMHGLKRLFGAIQDNCDETGIPPSACNVVYVYDSSDYTRYLKQRAVNRNYNDRSYGGDDYHTTQSKLRSSKRFFS